MTAFSKIVADVDPRSERQPALARLRQLGGAAVELIACDQVDAPHADLLAMEPGLAGAREDYTRRLEDWLEQQAAELRAEGFDVNAGVSWHAPRYEAILDRAENCGADLVMRSARHHSRLERLLVSATDWELVRRARQTVWLVKKEPSGKRAGINVLAAVDPVHSAESRVNLDTRILDTAQAIAGLQGGQLHVMHAWQPGAAIAPAVASGPHVPMPLVRVDRDTIDAMRGQRRDLLGRLTKDRDIAPDHVHLVGGPVTDALDELVAAHDIDVIVAGGRSRGRLERLIIGSTAEAILEHADCDVVVVKPDGKEES